ncbi:MAG TPA: tRNA (adenosine(37)-N6)-threonylcarbamoyltransferase complex dimerization subunit type 1 TsaB [Xanthobacteraceae bacterium]|nr:tRNA (adenosine(37)-N6)-threonylcarbamoyltransferase complex dimerization subunit type 1 TsaB [Xanthobacteraceae bacterium]
MRVLAIDTALAACSAAVFDSSLGQTLAAETLPMVRGHAEALLPQVARVMDQAKIEFTDLDRIVVTIGPGSFTGLRVGISAARAIALAASKPAVGVTTLAAFAAPPIASDDSSPVAAVIDARHDHVYLQVFGRGGRTLVPPRIVSVAEAMRAVAPAPARIVGSAASLLAAAWPAGEPKPKLIEEHPAPDIAWVARLGVAAMEAQEPPKPLYLRLPDAQPQDAARLPRR